MKCYIDGRKCSIEEYMDRVEFVPENSDEAEYLNIDDSEILKLEIVEDIVDIVEHSLSETDLRTSLLNFLDCFDIEAEEGLLEDE